MSSGRGSSYHNEGHHNGERTLQVQVLCLEHHVWRRLWEVTSWGLVQAKEFGVYSRV